MRIGKTRGVNLLVWTEPWRGPDGRFIPRVFPILTSSTWLIIYLAYSLLKLHINLRFFVLRTIWFIFRVGKCRLTSLSDVITTCVRTHSRTSNGWKRRQEGFPTIVKSKDCPIFIRDIEFTDTAGDETRGMYRYDPSSVDHVRGERQGHVMG